MFTVCPACMLIGVRCTAPPAGIVKVKKLPDDISIDAVVETIASAFTVPFTLPLNVTSLLITPGMLNACDAVVAESAVLAFSANEELTELPAVKAYDADVAVEAFDAYEALTAIAAVDANEDEVAVSAFTACEAEVAVEALPNNEPVIVPVTFNGLLIVTNEPLSVIEESKTW